ncbi:E3 SUMO-protein ligase ZBED1-like isoform X1 [Drosophila kikkawai]|uniref:E3 SUMO-protein ligase ZBED1-like isoform X1 n=1 Tax=Drosophila kikkawai TaxID=30033 RepID=A0A6P4I881_DROKI|nr:zinc finger BED domain-containing protein 4-like isoform X2 [Drosophila kikkawai]
MNVKSNYTNITNGTAKCKHCERIIKTSGNSSNLSSHLRNKHSEIFATCGQKKLSATFDKVVTISESFKSAAAFKENGHKTKEISEAIIYMICKDNMPVRCVEKEGLRGLLKKCVPHFKMPSRSTVTTMIEEKYIQCVGAVVKILSSVQDFAFTCDAVTIPNSTRSFLTITAHFIANDSLNAICLAASRMDQSHTSDYVSFLLEETCAEFQIDAIKWTTLTTDSASNMKCASKLFLGVNKHVPCFAHSINLVVDATIKEISSFSTIVDKIKRVVMHFKHSPAMMDQLRKAQTNEGTPEGKIKTLIQNVDTRWNSCLDMMESFSGLANKVALILLQKSERVKGLPEMLNVSELTICRDLCSLLQPFKKATEQISGENYVTVSDVAKPDDVFDDFMSSHNSSILKEVRSASEENKELKLYFSLPQAAWESNPLDVWKSHKATMPGLYKVALKHLITPGSSVPSERLASAIKCVVCDARSRMTDRHIKQRVFLKSLSPKYWV